MARPREISDTQLAEMRAMLAEMRAMLAEGMPFTEVASVIGRSEFFVRKYCRGESQWTPAQCGAWASVARKARATC